MSKTDAFENDLLELIFNAAAIPGIAEDDTSSPATTLTVSLHTASPGEAGDMSASEAAYPGYVRQTVARNSGGWLVTGNSVSPSNDIDFPTATGGNETITHVGIGSGAGSNLMYFGALTPTILVSNGVTPRVTTASTITED